MKKKFKWKAEGRIANDELKYYDVVETTHALSPDDKKSEGRIAKDELIYS